MEPTGDRPEGAEILQGMRILIANDMPDLVQGLVTYLEGFGAIVEIVNDGVGVLRKISLGMEFGLLILDIQMLVIHGDQVIKSLRGVRNTTSILIYSTSSRTELEMKGITEPSIQVSASLEEVMEKILSLLKGESTIITD